ncbi:ABC transporter ATP-binding protein [Sesbania bispinosa]|nr:ABC transporter ATP-binding protein [Sesbania bispinosa]
MEGQPRAQGITPRRLSFNLEDFTQMHNNTINAATGDMMIIGAREDVHPRNPSREHTQTELDLLKTLETPAPLT